MVASLRAPNAGAPRLAIAVSVASVLDVWPVVDENQGLTRTSVLGSDYNKQYPTKPFFNHFKSSILYFVLY